MISDSTTTGGRSRPTAAELRARRLAAGLTQRELAGLADCSLASIANMEHGYVPRSSNVLARVLEVLNDARPPGEAGGANDPAEAGGEDDSED